MELEADVLSGSTGRDDSSTVQWYVLQTMLEQSESDVLILLDCCAAASSAAASGNGVTELIAACGFETWAPGVGEHSFSRSLIEELKYLSHGRPFSVTLLHNKVLSRIKYWKPRYNSVYESKRRKTPIYIQLANDLNRRSIELTPIPLQRIDTDVSESPKSQDQNGQSSSSEDVDMVDSGSSQSSLAEVWPDPQFQLPKVMISIALKDEQRLRADSWSEWLKSVPALVKHMDIQGVYKSDSTVILGLLSVAVWDLLPEHPAISFICFVKSRNLLGCLPNLLENLYPTKRRKEEDGDIETESNGQAYISNRQLIRNGIVRSADRTSGLSTKPMAKSGHLFSDEERQKKRKI